MPRAKKTDKFFFKLPKKNGYWKNKTLIGVNYSYEGKEEITFEELNNFLKENKIDPSKIKLKKGFLLTAEA